MWIEVLKKLFAVGLTIKKGMNLKNSAKHGGGVLLLVIFLYSLGAIDNHVFDVLVQIIPTLTIIDYIVFLALLTAGYLVWLTLDIIKAYKNYIVREIEYKKPKDTKDDNVSYRDKEFKDIER